MRAKVDALDVDMEAIDSAIKSTSLKGRISASDLERWGLKDTAPSAQTPLWLSVLISMASSLGMSPEEVNKTPPEITKIR